MKTDQIVMTKDPSVVVSIDVFEVKEGDQERMAGYALELIQNAETDPDFIVGATHRGRPAAAQPTPAPKNHAWVAIFAQWKFQGHGRAFAGTERGREILRRATSV